MPGMGEGMGEPMGEGMGEAQAKAGQPGKTPGKGLAKGPSQEKNEGLGKGDRVADNKASDGRTKLDAVDGDGGFTYLPPKQRELLRQALSERLPPEFAHLIEQYYMNIARGRPVTGTAPMTPKR